MQYTFIPLAVFENFVVFTSLTSASGGRFPRAWLEPPQRNVEAACTETRKLATPTKRRILPLKEELKFLEFLAAATGQVATAPAGSQVSRFSRWTLNLFL